MWKNKKMKCRTYSKTFISYNLLIYGVSLSGHIYIKYISRKTRNECIAEKKFGNNYKFIIISIIICLSKIKSINDPHAHMHYSRACVLHHFPGKSNLKALVEFLSFPNRIIA